MEHPESIGISTHSERGTEKVMAEYRWLLQKAVKGGEKELDKLKRWVESHNNNIAMYDENKKEMKLNAKEKWFYIEVLVRVMKREKEEKR